MSSLAEDVRLGLTSTPKTLSPKWFYDARGSELFDEITRLPEYYPTRAERAILDARAGEIARLTAAETLIELGSGTSEKTRVLLDALTDHGTLQRFVPFDVSEEFLHDAAEMLRGEYPGLAIEPMVGDFEHDLPRLPVAGKSVVAFLGGTIGNLFRAERACFLAQIAATLESDDFFLLGTDLVKDVDRLEAAYNDDAGVTAEFNKNMLRVINRELGADFDPDRFEHVAYFDRGHECIEMHLRSLADQVVRIPALDLVVEFAQSETLRTEISAKFRKEGIEAELNAAGLELTAWWTDHAGEFALSLSTTA